MGELVPVRTIAAGIAAAAAAISGCASGGSGATFDDAGVSSSDGPAGDAFAGADARDAGDAGRVDDAADVGAVGDAMQPDSGPAIDASAEAGGPDGEPIDGDVDAGSVDAAPEAALDAPTDAALDEGARDAPGEAPSDGGSCVTSPPADYCSSVPPLAVVPVIDGVLDCGPALVPMTPQGWNGSSSLPAGNSASIAAAWRPDGIYVFVQVVTPAVIPADSGTPPYYGAGAEVYVDSNVPASSTYDNPGAMQLVAAAPSGSAEAIVGEGYRNGTDQGPWSPARFGTFLTPTGFVLEAFVVAGDLGLPAWAPASSRQVGFDVAVNVSYATASTTGSQGHRAGQYFFHVGAAGIGAPYADARSFCTPTLQ
jgi:hypothetical protein